MDKSANRAGLHLAAIVGALCAALGAAPAPAIVLGQLDDFQNGTLQNWTGGTGSGGTAPINVSTGGPDGTGDRYLQISANDTHLGTNNTVQWSGNYTAAQVTRLIFHLNNTGANPLALRISVHGPGGTFATTNETVLPPGSGWVAVEFGLDAASLTQTAGFGTLAQTLANVSTLLIRHDPDPISPFMVDGDPVSGTLGIDNVRALPEPGVGVALSAAIAVLSLLACARGRYRSARAR